MATYRYLFADLLTNTIVAELPLTDVSFSQTLNDSGSFSGSLLLSDARTTDLWGTYKVGEVFTLDSDTATARTAIYVERDGLLVWGGIIWSRPYQSDSQTIRFEAREFMSYFQRRRVTSTVVFSAVTDQFTVVKTIIDTAQSAPYGNIGVVTSGIGTSGVGLPDVLPIFAYERRIVSDVIRDLSRQNTPYGFDYSIDVSYDSNFVPTKVLNLYYPRKGLSPSTTNPFAPMLEFPASIIAYDLSEDGGSMANTIYGAGPGSNEGQYVSSKSNTASLTDGYPLLEDSVSFTQIPNPLIVDELTQAEVNARYEPVMVLKASWSPTTNPITGIPVGPVWGEFQLGDTFRIRITDDRFPNTAEFNLRLQSFGVSVGDNGSVELISGTFVIGSY